MGHVADMGEAVQRDEAAQALGMMGGVMRSSSPTTILVGAHGRREKAANVDRLTTAGENGR